MKRKSKKRFIWIGIIVVFIAVAGVAVVKSNGGKKDENGRRTVKVEKKTIVDKALAVGSIEPINEIAVKSKVSGVVGKMFVEAGDYVEAGTIVVEVNPDPTPLELAQAKRNVEMAQIEMETLRKELERKRTMQEKGLVSDQEFEVLKQQFDEASLRHQINKEQLELIEKGKVKIADTSIETVVKAPISGFILEKLVNLGDPVVPLTSYQPGTPLLTMADMKDLLFKGTVDEIDVGKIEEGMTCELQVGALPGKKVRGQVNLISLKAQKEDNTTVFPVEINVTDTDGAVLRAGYSANASIIIAQRDSVLSIPERVVTFRNDSAFVMLPKGETESEEVYIETGLSDAITIEVLSGLEDGQEVLEKEVREII
ncbi:efflux RND transporter periplasmic adaptor subunit [candidate division KSB1 bacterium]|nr:efflux RND transporter periplasmic adaptor subunit [candidate division KSB1 bacterium]RQW01949.1 MAG: efflux RND transporter periplasmic adaptor subunit [candidate division KSB1 bacterium]